MRRDGQGCLAPPPASLSPASLSVAVSRRVGRCAALRRLRSSVSPSSFPSMVPHPGALCRAPAEPDASCPAPPSLHGVPPEGVPPLRRYYEALRLPAALPAALRFLRLAVPCPAPLVRSRCARTRRAGAWRWSSRTPDRHAGPETTGSPRFLGSPHVCVPSSMTPAGPAAPDQ